MHIAYLVPHNHPPGDPVPYIAAGDTIQEALGRLQTMFCDDDIWNMPSDRTSWKSIEGGDSYDWHLHQHEVLQPAVAFSLGATLRAAISMLNELADYFEQRQDCEIECGRHYP